MTNSAHAGQFRRSHRPWTVLIGCCITCCFGFSIPATIFSVFFTPLAETLQTSMATIMMYVTLLTWASVPVLMFGGKLLKRFDVSKLIVVMGVAGGAVLMLLSAFPSVPMLMMAGVVMGFAYPICSIYSAPIIIENWFHKNTGFWSSVSMACVGFGGAILSPLITSVITSAGWQAGMMALGATFLAIEVILGSFFLRMSPLPYGILPWGATQEDVAAMMSSDDGTETAVDPAKLPGIMLKEALKSPAFWLIALAMAGIGILSNFNMNINTLVQASGYDPAVAALALSASSIGNIAGKPVWGFMKDKWGAGGAAAGSMLVTIVGMVFYLYGISVYNEMVIYVAAFIGGCGICATLILPALSASSAFGVKDYGSIYGVVFGCRQLIAGLAAPLFGMTLDVTGSYSPMLTICIVASVVIIVGTVTGVSMGRKIWAIESSDK